MKEKLGIDIGGVIMDRANDGTDTSFFSANYLQTTEVRGASEAIHRLVTERFGEDVFLISKCGVRVATKTLHWLDHRRFYATTGIKQEHVHFCRERHEKAGICEELGITHFVDDRLEVLSHLTMVGTLYLFQSRLDEVHQFRQHLHRVHQVWSWKEILAKELP